MKTQMKTRGMAAAFFFLCLSQISIAGTQATYYVSPTGNDTNSGTSAGSPFKTIEKAKKVVGEINANMTGDIHVCLMKGTFALSDTLTFTPDDSGTKGYRVIYKAFPGETPVISGGRDISTGWSLHDAKKNIYKKTGVNWAFRQLYVDDNRAIRARVPNVTNEITGEPYYRAKNKDYPYIVSVSDEDSVSPIGPWATNGVSEMHVMGFWSRNMGRISGYSEDRERKVYFKSPDKGLLFNHHSQPNAPYYFENAYELIDADGEWFLDTNHSTLYYKPRAGQTMNVTKIVAPKLESIIRFAGASASNKVSNITISGISLQYCNWLAPSSYGYVDLQAGVRYQSAGGEGPNGGLTGPYVAAGGMVELKYTSNVTIENNTLMFAGGYAVMGLEGTDHTLISWNKISKIAGGGIGMGVANGGWDERVGDAGLRGQSINDTIADNTIDTISLDYADALGIIAMLPQHIVIAHNEISNANYDGISVGWNWDDKDAGCHDVQVYANKIHDIMKLLSDGGAIYSLGYIPDCAIYNNHIYNMVLSSICGDYPDCLDGVGIYLDNGSTHKTVYGNVLDIPSKLICSFGSPNSPQSKNVIRALPKTTFFENDGFETA